MKKETAPLNGHQQGGGQDTNLTPADSIIARFEQASVGLVLVAAAVLSGAHSPYLCCYVTGTEVR